jgi:hypothetical protein
MLVVHSAHRDSRRIRRRGAEKSFAVAMYRPDEVANGDAQPSSAKGLKAMVVFMRQL